MAQRRFRVISPGAAELQPVLTGLFAEYRQRYGDYFSGHTEEDPPERYTAPEGLFLVLEDAGEIIATGAYKPYRGHTAEIKRIWTDKTLRGQGIARSLVSELERYAIDAGYREMYLTTGFRQPEAVALYLSLGYQPGFDIHRDFEEYSRAPYDGRLRFTKTLVAPACYANKGANAHV
ncbi:GNAT family N-acetyltransferase [Tatumella terrea]|uniref:GNAT family N-acetyltransferase n=1 Tax=Tatumella terrea TaxID=419007 RepID=UPI0031D77AD4